MSLNHCFSSFCLEHRPVQQIAKRSNRPRFFGTARTQCAICVMGFIPTRTTINVLGTPCCKKYFHRDCIQVSRMREWSHSNNRKTLSSFFYDCFFSSKWPQRVATRISSVQPATTSRNFEKKCLKLESTLLIG